MLKVKYSVLNFFQLVWRVFLKLTLNDINKSPEISKILIKKSFEIQLFDNNAALLVAFILSILKINSVTKK